MITINLLPKDRQKASIDWLPKVITIGVAVLLIGAALGVTAVVSVYSLQKNAQLKRIEKDLAQLSDVLEESRTLEEKQKVVEEKKAIINDLVINRIGWAQKLNALALLVPDRVWLEDLELRRVETKFKPPPVKDPKSGQMKPQKTQIIVDEYVDITAVTADIGNEAARMAEMMNAIRKSDFYSGFEDLRHVKSALEPWQSKSGRSGGAGKEEYNPDVWRFKLTMKRIKKDAPKNEAPGKTSPQGEQVLAKA